MVETFELALHGTLFIFAAITPILMYYAYTKFSKGDFKTIIKYYLIAFFFSAFRWAGGSMARLDMPITESLYFNILWTASGILAAVFGLYASKLLLDFSKIFGFAKPEEKFVKAFVEGVKKDGGK